MGFSFRGRLPDKLNVVFDRVAALAESRESIISREDFFLSVVMHACKTNPSYV